MFQVVFTRLTSETSLVHIGEYDRNVFALNVCHHVHILIPRSVRAGGTLRYQDLFDLREIDLRIEYDPIDLLFAPLDQHTHVDDLEVNWFNTKRFEPCLFFAHQVDTPLVDLLNNLVYLFHRGIFCKVLS